jgi:hypothetical protein
MMPPWVPPSVALTAPGYNGYETGGVARYIDDRAEQASH